MFTFEYTFIWQVFCVFPHHNSVGVVVQECKHYTYYMMTTCNIYIYIYIKIYIKYQNIRNSIKDMDLNICITTAYKKGAAKFETEHTTVNTDQIIFLSIDMKTSLNFKKVCKFTFSKKIIFFTKN
jgi:hypothetical protein